MKRLTTVVLILLFCYGIPAAQNSTGQFFMSKDVHWRHLEGAPTGLVVASATVLFIGDDHLFVRDDCWLNKQDDKITISNGDPHNEYVGAWQPILDGLHYSYRLVHRTVERANETLPSREITGDAGGALRKDHAMVVDGKLFDPFKPTNAAEYERTYRELARMNGNGHKD